jgi:hypothetical protein
MGKIKEITFDANPPYRVILKENTSSGGKGIYVINTEDDMRKKITENPDVEFLVSQYIESAYTSWIDYTFINRYGYSVTTRFNGKKANIRPYFLVVINRNNIDVYLWEEFTFMAAMEDYNPGDITNTRSNITNISCHREYFKDNFIPEIMQSLGIPPEQSNIGEYTAYQHLHGLIRPPSQTQNPIENDNFYEIILKQIIRLVIANISVVKQYFACRPTNLTTNCHQVFCMDTHLDANKRLWYIETNSNCGTTNLNLTYHTTKEGERIFYDLLCRTIPNSYNYNNGWKKIHTFKR